MHLGGLHLTDSTSAAHPAGGASGISAEPNQRQSGVPFQETLARELKAPRNAHRTVAASRTELTSEAAGSALREAWKTHFGEEPREETVAILTAQWSHETGNGRSMFNYNFGGIKGTGPSGLTVSQRTKEGWGDNERTIRDNFRAYESAKEGASDYLSLLRRKYSSAIDAAHQGDPAGFVRELKKGGYFTGNEGAYIRSVSARATQLLGRKPVSTDDTAPSGVIDAHSHPWARDSVSTQNPRSLARSNSELNSVAKKPGQVRTTAPSSLESQVTQFRGPSVARLNAFDDALSRAALRIALDSPGLLGRIRGEDV